jgi:ubiquinone/menaquinone biosynthesis C-methylase UbiE
MKGHRWFAAWYDRMAASEEKKFMGAIRSEMLRDLTGRVLEIGAGTGLNFSHYRNGAEITATEPDAYMVQRAEERVAEADASIDLQQVAAEELPFPNETFDFAISTLVLCSVQDPRRALSEVRRVLKPGGEFRLYEHVRYKNRIGALSQDLILPAWRWFGAGCHPNRDTERHIREAGFEMISVEKRADHPPIPPMIFVRPHLQAIARRPARAQA